MARGSSIGSLASPALLWWQIAWTAGEMMLASMQVIGHRSRLMADAGLLPGPRDRRELTRMGTEKIAAASQSAWDMGRQLMMMNPLLAPRATADLFAVMAAWSAWATGQGLGETLQRQAALAEAANRSFASSAKLAEAAGQVVQRGLEPLHARATANATRLGRPRRRR